MLSSYLVCEEFTTSWEERGEDWRALFGNDDVRHLFQSADPGELRVSFVRRRGARSDSGADDLAVDRPNKCGLVKGDGTFCAERFNSRSALVIHRRCSPLGGAHGALQRIFAGAIVT